MELKILPARNGWLWVKDAMRLYAKAPLIWSMIVLFYWIALGLLSAIPQAGIALAYLFLPALSVSFMNGARDIARGGELSAAHLISGFRLHPRTLLILGVLYLLTTVAALGVTALIDGGVMMRVVFLGERPSREVMASPEVLQASLLAIALSMPILMAFWFAPPLAAWHGMSAAKSLFFSFIATLRNTRAFLVYGLALFGLTIVIPMLLTVICVLLFQTVDPAKLSFLFMPLLLTILPVIFASFYTSYADVFDDR